MLVSVPEGPVDQPAWLSRSASLHFLPPVMPALQVNKDHNIYRLHIAPKTPFMEYHRDEIEMLKIGKRPFLLLSSSVVWDKVSGVSVSPFPCTVKLRKWCVIRMGVTLAHWRVCLPSALQVQKGLLPKRPPADLPHLHLCEWSALCHPALCPFSRQSHTGPPPQGDHPGGRQQRWRLVETSRHHVTWYGFANLDVVTCPMKVKYILLHEMEFGEEYSGGKWIFYQWFCDAFVAPATRLVLSGLFMIQYYHGKSFPVVSVVVQ